MLDPLPMVTSSWWCQTSCPHDSLCPNVTPGKTHFSFIYCSWQLAMVENCIFVQYCNLQFTPNITGSKVFTPCSSVKPIEAWNAVNNVLFANFVFHHLLPNHSMRNVVILCKFYEGNSTFNEDLNKLFNRSSNLRHSSDCLDQDRMDDTLSKIYITLHQFTIDLNHKWI